MDPNAALERAFDGDKEARSALIGWISRGGFQPTNVERVPGASGSVMHRTVAGEDRSFCGRDLDRGRTFSGPPCKRCASILATMGVRS